MPFEKELEENPYQGQIVAHRVHGGSINLYGSPITHNEAVVVTIRRSARERDTGKDRYFAREVVAQVVMSPAQWAEFLTRMNCGDGTPCTIEATGKDGYIKEKPPAPDKLDGATEIESARETFSFPIEGLVSQLESLSQKGKAGKREIDSLLRQARNARDNFKPNLDFYLKMLKERATDFAAAAKHEIAAFAEAIPAIKMAQLEMKNKSNTPEIDSGE